MKNIFACATILCLCVSAHEALAQNASVPHLQKQGTATQLMVDNKPFIILGGELGNSTASSLHELDSVFGKLRAMNLNTVLTPAYWELIEPAEGQFDFTSIDAAIAAARANDLRIVFLWFGAWKNSMSCYAPIWVKENYRKYPRAVTKAGRPLEIMSAFSENNRQADKRAFAALMRHLAATDSQQRTVVMIQVENEIGMLEDARDYSKEANRLFLSHVPQQLIAYLSKHEATLRPSLRERWHSNGRKTNGSWTEVFGNGLETDELFMAWHYGLFVEEVSAEGKREYPLPVYLNAALNSRGRKPGAYPSAGPLAHLQDVWRAAAPSVDFIAPDIYDPGFTDWCSQYNADGNPLFIPEIRTSYDNAAKVFYAFGAHDAIGFSPFSIEDADADNPLAESYATLRQLLPLMAEKQGRGENAGFWFDQEHTADTIQMGDLLLIGRHVYSYGWDAQSKDGSRWPEAGGIILRLSDTEFLVAGTGLAVTFANARADNMLTGIGYVDKVKFENNKMIALRRMNGDQSHQGRHLRIEAGRREIQYVRLYRYK
jgi:beta-galactosidase GanA